MGVGGGGVGGWVMMLGDAMTLFMSFFISFLSVKKSVYAFLFIFECK